MSDIKHTPSNTLAFLVTICIFFFWGFAASGNALLIPVLKERFSLSQFASQLVEMSFYLAYFVGSLCYFLISYKWPRVLERAGEKRVMGTGLLLSALGTYCLIVAAGSSSYFYLLASLFTIAIGFALQQIIANPLLARMGAQADGTHRLIAAGAINSLGNTIGPLVLSFFLFGKFATANSHVSISSLRPMFAGIIALYIIFAILFCLVRLPEVVGRRASTMRGMGALRFPQLVFGMVAIFCYVGCEVAMQSNLPALVANPRIMGLSAQQAIPYFSLFGGSLMIGRWTGAIYSFNFSRNVRLFMFLFIPVMAFGLILLVNLLVGADHTVITDYFPFVFLPALMLLVSRKDPFRILLYAGLISLLLITGSWLTTGKVSMYCIIATACFTSLMWPCIFMLAINGLGEYTQQGSSLLIMMILGGAVVPAFQGFLSDLPFIDIHASFVLPFVCLIYISGYAVWQYRKVRSIGI